VFLVLYPLLTLVLAMVWVAIARGLHKASVASLVCALLAPVAVVVLGGTALDVAVISGVTVLLVARHASNLRRLIRGEEHGLGRGPARRPDDRPDDTASAA
jgi:glycerol-3-phosphate acyltransferase PlsY